jgi:hypothetical protein
MGDYKMFLKLNKCITSMFLLTGPSNLGVLLLVFRLTGKYVVYLSTSNLRTGYASVLFVIADS